MRQTIEQKRMRVYAQVGGPSSAEIARAYGAEGGFCRTDQLLRQPDSLPFLQHVISILPNRQNPQEVAEYNRVLDKDLLPIHTEKIKGVLRVLAGLPIVFEPFNSPLQDAFPRYYDLLGEVRDLERRGQKSPELRAKQNVLEVVRSVMESNPFLGLRGVRFELIYPEFAQMEVRAVQQAAVEVQEEKGIDVKPKILIPNFITVNELIEMRKEIGSQMNGHLGISVETPVAALTADKYAPLVDLVIINTDSLTQTNAAMGRYEAEDHILPEFKRRGIYEVDYFQVLDPTVRRYVEMVVEAVRKTEVDSKVGVNGIHTSDPGSIRSLHETGINFVVTTPDRVPAVKEFAREAASVKRGKRKSEIL